MFSIFSGLGGNEVLWRLPAVHGGGDEGAGLVGLLDRFLDLVTRGLGSGSSWNPLAGIEALASNVHPVLVHFPIAFLTVFLPLDILGLLFRTAALRQLASGVLYLGALGAVLAAAAGLIAEDTVPHGAAVHEIMEWHERAGLTVATLSVALAIWRAVTGARFSTMAQALHLFLGAVLTVCLLVGADLGGTMVYQHGVGVMSLQQADDHAHHHHDGPDLADDAEKDHGLTRGSHPER